MRNLNEIIKQWTLLDNKKMTTIPEWCWNRPYAHEPYYTFLHWLVQIMQAKLIVELGIDTGTSTIFMATAAPNAKIVSIELDLNSINNLQAINKNHNINNITTLHGSSIDPKTVEQIKEYGPIDLLFIDTLHTFDQASTEYSLYSPLMKKDGIVAHDDIHFSPDMTRYWEWLPEPKKEVNELHWTGFGLTGGIINL